MANQATPTGDRSLPSGALDSATICPMKAVHQPTKAMAREMPKARLPNGANQSMLPDSPLRAGSRPGMRPMTENDLCLSRALLCAGKNWHALSRYQSGWSVGRCRKKIASASSISSAT